jgi:hypothetical protein
MSHAIDLDAIRTRRTNRLAGRPPAQDEPTLEEDLAALITACEMARGEVDRLSVLLEDLQASAELWARLYEANVLRANGAEAERDELAVAVATATLAPTIVESRLAAVTRCLETLVRTCPECRRGRMPLPGEMVCGRCGLAVAALGPLREHAK